MSSKLAHATSCGMDEVTMLGCTCMSMMSIRGLRLTRLEKGVSVEMSINISHVMLHVMLHVASLALQSRSSVMHGDNSSRIVEMSRKSRIA